MQDKNVVPNAKRTERTRKALIKAARLLFLKKSYADSSTPEIVKAAGVTRGALYHHFTDKKDLLRAVIDQECKAVGESIERYSGRHTDPLIGLKKGSSAFISAMAKRGRTRLILIDGPAALGQDEILMIEDKYARRSLKEGLEYAISQRAIDPLPLQALLDIMSAMFDGASLKIEAGSDIVDMELIVHRLIDGLARSR